MGELLLSYRGASGSLIPVEADAITPDHLAGMDRPAIEKLTLHHGNQSVPLGELFAVRGDVCDTLRVEGDLGRVKGLGLGMKSGRLVIEGNAAMHVGAFMSGGTIEARGSVGDWAGAEMTGGLLLVRGDAGNRVGGAYRGSKHGMRGGVILVEGRAGHEAGGYMRRGLIAVRGDVGDFTGARMSAGTILLLGSAGIRTGGGMKRGTIVCRRPVELLPTFRAGGSIRPLFLRIILRALEARGFVAGAALGAPSFSFTRHLGDLAELGKGEILVAREA